MGRGWLGEVSEESTSFSSLWELQLEQQFQEAKAGGCVVRGTEKEGTGREVSFNLF